MSHDMVLDTRHGQSNGYAGPYVEHATAAGSVLNYSVQGQRRSRNKVHGLAIRLSTPAGDRLNLVTDLSPQATNAKGPITSALSPAVGYALRDGVRKPEAEQESADRIAAVIATGHRLLRDGISGPPALQAVQAAAHGLPLDQVQEWYRIFNGGPTTPGRTSVAVIARFVDAGFGPEDISAWFGKPYRSTPGDPARMAAFRAARWAPTEVRDLDRLLGARAPAAWAALPPQVATASAQAGLSAREAKRLVARGEWSPEAMLVLAALRD